MNNKHDLSKEMGSLTHALEPIITISDTLSFTELKARVRSVLIDQNLKASNATRTKWLNKLALMTRDNQKKQLMTMITNIYLAGSALGLNQD
jgi:hypothetical protein